MSPYSFVYFVICLQFNLSRGHQDTRKILKMKKRTDTLINVNDNSAEIKKKF